MAPQPARTFWLSGGDFSEGTTIPSRYGNRLPLYLGYNMVQIRDCLSFEQSLTERAGICSLTAVLVCGSEGKNVDVGFSFRGNNGISGEGIVKGPDVR